MAAGFARDLVLEAKHTDTSSLRRSLYLNERVFMVFVDTGFH